jgi:hypothetical protein
MQRADKSMCQRSERVDRYAGVQYAPSRAHARFDAIANAILFKPFLREHVV